jgi:hypothetical protein
MRSGLFRRSAAVLVIVAALEAAGCGSGPRDTPATTTTATARPPGLWSLAVCRQVAGALVDEGKQALAHFRPPLSSYPPDVALLRIRLTVGGLIDNHCAAAIAGRDLARGLSARRRNELFSHLPPIDVSYLRRGLAQS